MRPTNDTLLRALLREPTEYTPVWLMRQAGRYMAEYNATRKRAGSFLNLAKSPALATEVTLQPVDRYPLDAAILFSDILTVPDAMGLGLYFAEGEGPKFERPLRTEADVARLAAPDPEQELRYVMDAVRQIRGALANRIPLIGFSGSPFTLACYMVEGGGSDDFRQIKTMLYARPDLLHRILQVNARAVADYLNAQIAAGAQAVMIFDTWGGALADGAYQEFSLAYMRRGRVAADARARWRARSEHRLHQGRRSVARGDRRDRLRCGRPRLDREPRRGAAAHRRSLRAAGQPGSDGPVRAGRADRGRGPRVLDAFGPPRRADGRCGGHVFNLGHGISQFTPPEAVQTAGRCGASIQPKIEGLSSSARECPKVTALT